MDPSRRVLDAHAARLVAADLLSRRPWTSADLTARLSRRGAPAVVATAVVAELVSRGHLDDAAFARDWVAVRTARGYGAARLRMDLRARGIATALIDAALTTIRVDGLEDLARELARRRLSALQQLEARAVSAGHRGRASFGRSDTPSSGRQLKRRAFGTSARGSAEPAHRIAARLRDYLLRRGYSADIATRVARELTGAPADADATSGDR